MGINSAATGRVSALAVSHSPELRIAAVASLPVVVAVLLSVPAFQPTTRVHQGIAGQATVCLGLCSQALAVGNLILACKTDLLGVAYSCNERFVTAGNVEATYVRLPSVASLFGLARMDGTLLELKRDGRTLYSSSISQQVWQSMYGGWVFHAIYWPVAGLFVWLWPQSWFSRKFRERHRGEA